MKKLKLFLAAMAAMVGLSAQAQLTDGTVYWIQDAATGQFISQGANWGTQATVQDVGGIGFEAVKVSDGVYKFKNIMWNKVNNADLGLRVTDGYCDQAASDLTLTASGEGYLVGISGGNYLCNNQAANSYGVKPIGLSTNSADATVWKFLTKAEYDLAILANKNSQAATIATTMGIEGITTLAELEAELAGEDYVTVNQTSKIINAALNEGNTNGWASVQPNQRDKAFGSESGTMAEAWNGCVVASQTVSGLPNGLYKITFVGTFRPKGSAESQNLSSEQTSSPAYVFANDDKEEFIHWIDVSAKANNRAAVKNNAADYTSAFYTYVTNGTINLGVKQDTWYNGSMWCPFGYFTLTQIYSIASYTKAYNEAMAAATAAQTSLTGFDLYATQKSTLDNVISNYTLTGSDLSNPEALSAAADALNAAAVAVAREKAACDQYANIVTTIGSNTNVNLTSFVSNAGFEDGNLNGWTSDDGGNVANNNNFSGKSGNWYVERWKSNGALGNGSITHDGVLLPAGVYTISVNAQNIEQYNGGAAGTGLNLVANDSSTPIGAAGSYTAYVKMEDKSELVIKFVQDNCTGNWISYDNITLTYLGADFPEYTLVTNKMNKEVANAQTAAKDAFEADGNADNYGALIRAINAAQASAKAYGYMTAAVTRIDAALEAATSATESVEAYTGIKSAYTAGTIADADIMSKIVDAYNDVIPVIKTQTAANADFTLAIQNQSFEYGDLTGWTVTPSSDTGVRDASNPTYAATGSDGFYLFNTWWQGVPLTQTVTGLPNGQYTLTASVSSDGATIYLIANGEHNDGTETAGEHPTKDTFQEATFTFLVKDGNATIGVVGGANGEAGVHKDYVEAGYWWYKADNFRLVKNRELTEEEMAIVPTGVTLDKNEVTLTATERSVTLTPTFEPENATNTVTWTSSDVNVATVADGVVTAVAPGTATITVTSTLDENVKASCEVTVEFPESTVPATIEYAEGPALTVYTLSQNNLLKNGTFGYPNAVATWKTVGYTTDAVASNFTITAEGGAVDGGAFITTNAGGAGAVTTLRKSVPVEVGKKYYFSVYTSGKAPASNNFQYNALFKMSDAVTESGTLKEFEWPQGANNETTEWSKTEFVFTAETPYVGVRMGWNASSSFDEFVLAEITEEATVGNVQYALDAIPTSNIGTGAFQYSQDAIDAANALVQGTATVEDVTNAYNAVTTLNVPEATQAYNLVFNCEGHNYTGNALTLIPNSAQTQGLYGLKYLAPANVNLAQAFYFTHTTGNKYKVHAIDTDLEERYITTQAEGYGTTWYEGIRTIDDASKAMEIEIRPNGDGLYLMWNTGANKPLGHNGNNNNDLFTNYTANFQFVETQKPSITINTTAAGWGTTILPFAVAEIPDGVKVYTCAETVGATLTLEEVKALEANKPYIIEGAWEATLTGDAQGTALSYTEGLLTGTYVEMNAEALNGKYIMQKQGEKVGFFLVNSANAQPKLKANRAYMTAPDTGSVKAFLLGDDAADAIQSVFDGLVNGDAYDLGGRKVSKLQKGGVYIVNGKKVIVK